jgi:F0F1-type ATP synthase assembly protein I
VAFEFSGTIAGGAVVGWLIDGWLGSGPWALVICTLVAVAGGFLRLVTLLRRFERSDLAGEP